MGSMSVICETVLQYCAADVHNADEFGVLYQRNPTNSVATSRTRGQKLTKERMFVLACANFDESDKDEFIIVGSAWLPNTFKKKTGTQLCFDYQSKENARMNSAL